MTSKVREFRGSLNAIFSDTHSEHDKELKTDPIQTITKNTLPINRIKPREGQPRRMFDEVSLEELTQSIKSKGVIQPIIVRIVENGFYEIVVGERRWRASKRAGLSEIPAIVSDYDRSDRMAVALIENIQRENLNPLEEAKAIHDLLEECSMTHAQVAESIGKSRAAVSNLLRLLNLEGEVKNMVNAGLLEMGHAKVLLGLTNQSQIEAAKLVIGKSLSVRETEQLIQRINNPIEKQITKLDPEFEKKTNEWKNRLAKQLFSKVNVHFGSSGKGRVVIYFESIEEADWLMDNIKVSGD